jgi:hypothetical protein
MTRTSAQPSDDAQRASCISAIALLLENTEEGELLPSDLEGEALEVPEVVRVAVETLFLTVQERYLELLGSYRVSIAVEAAAVRAARRADEVFDLRFRRWSKSVLDSAGKAQPRALARLLSGHCPGELVRLPFRREVELTSSLLNQLKPLPHLMGNRKRLDKLVTAHKDLSEKVDALERARRARKAARRHLDDASLAFDRTWKTLVALLETSCPEVALASLPAFPVRSHKRKDPASVPTAPVADELDPDDADEDLLDEDDLGDDDFDDEDDDLDDEGDDLDGDDVTSTTPERTSAAPEALPTALPESSALQARRLAGAEVVPGRSGLTHGENGGPAVFPTGSARARSGTSGAAAP